MNKSIIFILLFLGCFGISLKAQNNLIESPFGIGDNELSSISKELIFNLDSVPRLLIIECYVGSLNVFNHFQVTVNQKSLTAHIQTDLANSRFSFWDTDHKNYTVVNEGVYDKEKDSMQSTAKLIVYVPNSYLQNGENSLRFYNEDNDSPHMDDYWVSGVYLHPRNIEARDFYKDWRVAK
ncbi:MAG: hypothetical protein CNE98_01135 [Bacteroidetes bacterium MED-G17]|nr:MAG: hypothetical protein CBB99_04945 [Bacteroidetes bacterium TMED39]PDH53209.1 MAG: hypothetical protein CNE98_01135 [Bacteroidetes bacterium MED-G17]|tara:strand:- start:2770 stop:3309 length:540 start_codon:yes stop_codon:yes gene_type:complete